MATRRVIKVKCHHCEKVFREDQIMIDDEPFGLLCVPCEDVMYGKWLDIGDEYPLTEH